MRKNFVKKFLMLLGMGILLTSNFVFRVSSAEEKELLNNFNNLPIEFRASGGPSIIGSGSYLTYFRTVKWVHRSDGVTLSIYPTPYLRFCRDLSIANKAFDALYDVHKNDYYWNNTSNMRKQFICHFKFATSKDPWNIEPWKTSTNWKCN